MSNTTNKTNTVVELPILAAILLTYAMGFSFLFFLIHDGKEMVDARWGIPGMAAKATYAVATILVVFTLLLLVPHIIDLYYRILNARYRAICATGVYDFIDAATCIEEARKIVGDRENSLEEVVKKLKKLDGRSFRDIAGVVCDEEVIGIAEGVHLTVTVTKPKTLKAFKKLPKETRKYVDIVYAPEE